MTKKKITNLSGRNLRRARKILIDIITLFEKNSISYHLEGGTLLGIIRDGDLLPWDHDVDISVPMSELDKIVKLGPELLMLGYKYTRRRSRQEYGPIKHNSYSVFKVKPFFKYVGHMVSPKLFYDIIVLDIFVKINDNTHTYWQAQGKIMRVENKFYESYELIPFMGKMLRVPNNYKDYLTQKYGDWITPVKEWECGKQEGTICS